MFDKRNNPKQGVPKEITQENSPAHSESVSNLIGKSAVIGRGININGDISGTESLLIEGRVEGKISLPGHRVEVGPAGCVHADIVAKFVKIDGELKGNIEGKEKVIISKSGNVRGNISAPRVLLEDGAIFKGSIDIDPLDSAPVELPLASRKASDNVKSLSGKAAKKDSGYTVKGG